MSLGTRIKRLRQDRNWSQAQFALKLKVHQKQISGYERNVYVPSTDLLIRVAELFNVSLDYLAFEDRDDSQQVQIADRDLLQKMEAIDQLTDADRNTVKAVLDTFIIKNQFQQLAAVPKEQTA
jgi:transcriptional regulator with XRE-family HTH domain